MSAGKPDWNRLMALGKLPKEARGNIPLLAALDAAESRIVVLEKVIKTMRENGAVVPADYVEAGDKNETTQLKCPVEGCTVMVGGKTEAVARMNLGKHKKAAHPEEKKGE